jgi:hypothetical protein
MPREGGASSTPRLFDSIAEVSGILDRPASRAMTAAGGIDYVIASAAKQSILSLRGEMDCFAEPVIGRAFARPVGSQ